LIQETLNQGQGISILFGYLVESTIIHTESKGAILLLDKQNWGVGWRLGMLNEPLGKVFSKVITQGLEFGFR
jgi:hypothetical protein